MADDTPTTVLGSSLSTTTFLATKDGSSFLTLQSTPRTNGAEVTAANPLPIAGAVTTADGANVTQGAVADAAYTTGSGSVISILKGIYIKVAAALGVNISQINGASVAVGHGVAATALRVELPTDGTGIVGLGAGINNIGTVALGANQSVNLAQIAGTAALTGPGTGTGALRIAFPTDGTLIAAMTGTVSISGTPAVSLAAGAANIGTVAVAGGITATTVTIAAGAATIGALVSNQSVNLGQVGGTAVALGVNTKANSIPVAIASDQTVTAAGTFAATGTLATTQSGTWTMQPGNTPNTVPWLIDINGGTANAVRGFVTSTATTAATIIASPGSGVALFVDSLELGNTSTTQAVITLNDSVTTQLIVPASGGNNPRFVPPLSIAANTALTFTTTPAVTTLLAGGQAHKA